MTGREKQFTGRGAPFTLFQKGIFNRILHHFSHSLLSRILQKKSHCLYILIFYDYALFLSISSWICKLLKNRRVYVQLLSLNLFYNHIPRTNQTNTADRGLYWRLVNEMFNSFINTTLLFICKSASYHPSKVKIV